MKRKRKSLSGAAATSKRNASTASTASSSSSSVSENDDMEHSLTLMDQDGGHASGQDLKKDPTAADFLVESPLVSIKEEEMAQSDDNLDNDTSNLDGIHFHFSRSISDSSSVSSW